MIGITQSSKLNQVFRAYACMNTVAEDKITAKKQFMSLQIYNFLLFLLSDLNNSICNLIILLKLGAWFDMFYFTNAACQLAVIAVYDNECVQCYNSPFSSSSDIVFCVCMCAFVSNSKCSIKFLPNIRSLNKHFNFCVDV